VERARTPCPLRALHGGHLRSFTANHGQPKPLLKGSVVASHVVPKLMMNAVPPAGLRSRMVRGWARRWWVIRVARYSVTSAPEV
jgi:hypothetical protein